MTESVEILPAAGTPDLTRNSLHGVRCMFCGSENLKLRNWEAVARHFVPMRGHAEKIGGTQYKLEFDCLGCKTRFKVEREK